MAGIGLDVYKLGFQKSPIILTAGVATLIPGGMLPIIALTEAANLIDGLLSGLDITDLDNTFANFKVQQGTELIKNEVATYPFANQGVAANSIIVQPLRVSVLMTCPARNKAGAFLKTATMTALQKVLSVHNTSGGLYTVVSPSYIYTDCMMLSMTDVSGAETTNPQSEWQIDFFQPLITGSAAVAAQSNLMSKLSNQTKVTSSSWSSLGTSAGVSVPTSAQSVVDSLKSLIGGL